MGRAPEKNQRLGEQGKREQPASRGFGTLPRRSDQRQRPLVQIVHEISDRFSRFLRRDRRSDHRRELQAPFGR